MKSPILFLTLVALLSTSDVLRGQAAESPINWDKAKELYQRERRGETLSEEDAAFLNRAKEMRRGGGGSAESSADRSSQRQAPESMTPLTDMTAEDRYEGEDGGLYGGGSSTPPPALQEAADKTLSKIQPLDSDGQPSENGAIGFISISMSNATMEFSTFKKLADADSSKAERVTIVDCAQGGQAMAEWVSPDARPWQVAMERLAAAKVSPKQVQVAWIKLANKAPGGSMEDHLGKLESDTVAVIANARARFPNLRIVYLGSRIWAGNAKGNLNPEPYAYESAFAARRLIQKQDLASEPLLLWGPYLWAEGEKGRKIDDLIYETGDFAGDGVHPSASGRDKVANQLLEFLVSSPLAKGWFAK